MRRLIGTLAAGLSLFACLPAPAEAAWPERTVTLVNPFAAGGISDVLCRMTADRLRARFNQPFIVENVPGAAGTTAAQRVARAEPDGYTLFWGTLSQIAIAPFTNRIGYDPVKDFKPVSIVATSPFVITAGGPVKAATLAEFIAQVKASPGKIAFGSAGQGTLTHLSAALFLKNAGLEMNHVPYRGIGPAFQDLLAGHIAMVSGSPVEVKPFQDNASVKLLAVTSDKRTAALPGVPTVSESMRMPQVITWNAVLAPGATPAEIVAALSRELRAAAQDKEFVAGLEKLGVDPIVHTPEEFAAMIAADIERWRGTIADLGLKPQ